tara:strand:+ start:4309 stop:4584 length:276 start_codon:yes stop_codon:yes gene_type:complete
MELPNFTRLIINATNKQKAIFAKTLYETAPDNVPDSYLENILNEFEGYTETLSPDDLTDVRQAVKILKDVEGFPHVTEQTVMDILEQYGDD